MRKAFYRSMALGCVALLASCGLVDLESSPNGKLDGAWHMETVDTLATGGSLDLRKERRYWLVQGSLFQFFSPELWNGQRFVSHFSNDGGILTIQKLFMDQRAEGDPPVEDVELLRPFGINNVEGEPFVIETLTGKDMTLRNETLRLTFKKL